jgi:uncharacterized protein YqjF (DUF2071 family)
VTVADLTGTPISPHPAERVPVPLMFQSWNAITFVHWGYRPGVIQRLLPEPLALETFEGRAWVSITPFRLENLHPPLLPALPWLSYTPETNVRTYVRDPSGRSGIWFFSLDIARLAAVAFGRTAYRLPYMWGRLTVEESSSRIRYRGRRRWPGDGAEYDIEVQPGRPLSVGRASRLDHFLTARWSMFTRYGRFLAGAGAEHPTWPLCRARILSLDETLLRSAGIPPPRGDPVTHFSPGVHVRISAPRPTSGRHVI